MQVLQEMTREIARNRGSGTTGFEPDIPWLQHRIPRAEGMAITSYSPEDGPPREQSLLELVIREDGGIRLICGRGTDAFPRAGILPEERPPMAIITMLVLGLTHCVAALAGHLADKYAAYQGQWQLGVRMDRLRGAVPLDLLQGGNPLYRPGTHTAARSTRKSRQPRPRS